MPDLQSELKKLETLAFDDEGTTTEITMPLPHAFQPTNNVSRETFNYIKNNPGMRRVEVAKAMENRGFKKSSALALATQFAQQGMVRVANGGLFVAQAEYTPLKAKKAKVAKVTDKKLKRDIIKSVTESEIKLDTTVQSMLSRMSILQAREMYDELKKVFSA